MGKDVANSNSNRIYWIDWAKCIGIYLVVLGHMETLIGKQFIYMFHMPFFFILSGYLYKRVPFKQELIKSIKTLLVPYFIFNFLLSIICLSLGKFEMNDLSYIFLGEQELLPCRFFRPLWFLVSLFLIRLFCSFIHEKHYAVLLIILFVVNISLLYGNMLQNGEYSKDIFQLQTTLLCMPCFVLGHVFKSHDIVERMRNLCTRNRIFSLGVVLSAVICLVIGYLNGSINVFTCKVGKNPFIFYVVSIGLSLIAMCFCSLFLNKRLKYVEVVSKGTIFIIGTHIALIDGLSYSISKNSITSLVLSLIIMVFSYICIQFILKYCPFVLGKSK